jgi:hypothetical protein
MATRVTYGSEQKYEGKRKNDDELKDKKNEARRLRRASGKKN